MSGVVACFIATPPDVVKTRILSQDELSKRQKQPLLPIMQSVDDDDLELDGSPAPSILTIPGEAVTSTSLAATVTSNNNEGEAVIVDSTESCTSNLYNNEFFLNNNDVATLTSSPSSSTITTTNPFLVAQGIIEREGYKVLFSGAKERCIGAIPRFGITLGMHEYLEHYATSIGLLPTHL